MLSKTVLYKKIGDDLMTLAAKIAAEGGGAEVVNYSINGRSFSFRSVEEILKTAEWAYVQADQSGGGSISYARI